MILRKNKVENKTEEPPRHTNYQAYEGDKWNNDNNNNMGITRLVSFAGDE